MSGHGLHGKASNGQGGRPDIVLLYHGTNGTYHGKEKQRNEGH